MESQFWYYTSDSVFVYGKNNNVLTLLHTFNWPENSTQNIAPNTSLLYFAESGIQYDVHIQDSITIKSKQVKRTVGNESSFFLVRYQSEFFEIIGSNGAPYPIADYVSIFGQFSGLVCYEDSIFGAVTFGDTICECDCKTHVDSLLLRRTVGISEATKTTQQLHFDRAASQLHFMGAFPAEITDVVVYNALGQAVQRWRVHDTPTLDVSQLPQGVYWAVANGQWYKFLKQ